VPAAAGSPLPGGRGVAVLGPAQRPPATRRGRARRWPPPSCSSATVPG